MNDSGSGDSLLPQPPEYALENPALIENGAPTQNLAPSRARILIYDELKKRFLIIAQCLCIACVVAGIFFAIFFHFLGYGETALHYCRMWAIICALFMIISFLRMLNIWWTLKPINAKKGRNRGSYQTGGLKNQKEKGLIEINSSKNQISITMGFFICFMTLGAIYGYFEKITKIRIFWDFDFVLHYDTNFKEWDLIMDCFYAVFVLLYLLIQCFYFMFVAPVTHISVFDKTLFVSTLLINAFQKWVFESIEVHMEMCEEFNHAKHMCKTYINYTTSTKDLSHPKQELYASTNYLDPLTYTITMELFFACIALLFHFSHHEESHKDNRTVKETVELKSVEKSWIIWIIYLCIAGLLLAIIHMGPVIFVWPGYPSHQWERQGFRIAAYGLNSILTCWIIRYLHNPNEERFITVILNCFKKMDPDILILWISWIINVLLFIVKISIEYKYLYDTLESSEKPIYIVSQLGNIFEILSYILLIFLVGKLINYAEKASSNSMNNFVENHVVIFGLLSLLNFVACYKLKSLHYNLEKIQDEDALNLLILIQSTYPSTLLFNMTLCLCFASIAETLFKKGFYQFAKRKNFEFILPNFDGWLEIDVGEIEEHDYLTVVFHGIEYKNSKPKKVEIIFAFVKTTDENDIKKSDEILWEDLKKAAKILGIDEKQLKKMHVVIDKEKPLLIKIKSYFNNTQELYFLTHWLDNIVKANKNEKEKCVGDKQPYSEMQWLSLLKQLSESDEINENTEIIQRTINALSHFKTLRSSTSQETEATVLTIEKLDRRNDEKSQKAKVMLEEIENKLAKEFVSKILYPYTQDQNLRAEKKKAKNIYHPLINENELRCFFKTNFLNTDEEENLEFWENRKAMFPKLQKLVYEYQSIPSDMESTKKSLNILKNRYFLSDNPSDFCYKVKKLNRSFRSMFDCCKYTPEKDSKFIIGRSLNDFDNKLKTFSPTIRSP